MDVGVQPASSCSADGASSAHDDGTAASRLSNRAVGLRLARLSESLARSSERLDAWSRLSPLHADVETYRKGCSPGKVAQREKARDWHAGLSRKRGSFYGYSASVQSSSFPEAEQAVPDPASLEHLLLERRDDILEFISNALGLGYLATPDAQRAVALLRADAEMNELCSEAWCVVRPWLHEDRWWQCFAVPSPISTVLESTPKQSEDIILNANAPSPTSSTPVVQIDLRFEDEGSGSDSQGATSSLSSDLPSPPARQAAITLETSFSRDKVASENVSIATLSLDLSSDREGDESLVTKFGGTDICITEAERAMLDARRAERAATRKNLRDSRE